MVLDSTIENPGEAWGAVSSNSATMKFLSLSFAPASPSWYRGDFMLAEVLHHAARIGVFLDRELAWAGYQVAWAQGHRVAPPPTTNDRMANSNYFHNTLQFVACNPYQEKK